MFFEDSYVSYPSPSLIYGLQTESLFLVFRQSKVGVSEMGVVTMLKLAGLLSLLLYRFREI